MQWKQVVLRTAAVCTAVALTICGAYIASVRSNQRVMQTAGRTSDRQVIILDAGHGGSA